MRMKEETRNLLQRAEGRGKTGPYDLDYVRFVIYATLEAATDGAG